MTHPDLVYPEIDPALCDGCGQCVPACTPGALAIMEGKAMLALPERCEYDGKCEPACPRDAIRLPYLIVFRQ